MYFFRRNWRFKYKQNSRSSRRSSGRCLSERVDIFLSSGEPSGWSKHDVCDSRPATWMSPRAVPVRMRYTLSTALENSHSETDICLRAFCRFGSSSGLRLPPLRTMPIHKIVSKERCQSYFISRRSPHLGISKDSESCASAHRGVPLYFCMARSYANFLFIQQILRQIHRGLHMFRIGIDAHDDAVTTEVISISQILAV